MLKVILPSSLNRRGQFFFAAECGRKICAMGQNVEQRIAKLRDEINHHSHLYYTEARPQISDREFDRLMEELIELERQHPHLRTPDSPSVRIGGDVQDQLKPVKHAVPMMSIDNTYNEAEVRAFDERVRKGLGAE